MVMFDCDETTEFKFSEEKNALLQSTRGVSFEEIVERIRGDGMLDVIAHPNQELYAHQGVAIVELDAYAYVVPFVKTATGYFLKTAFPSRKATRQYLRH